MKWARGSVLCVSFLVGVAAVGFGGECPKGPVGGEGSVGRVGGASPADFYYNAAGTLVEADGLEGYVILDLESHGKVRFPLEPGFRLSADKKTRLHGIEALELSDFQTGDAVEVKFSSYDGRAVRLKLTRPGK